MIKYIQRYLGIILLVIACVIALISYDEYGISWDEAAQRNIGNVSAKYVFSDNKDLLKLKDRDYGVAFELPLIIIEKALDLRDSRSIFLMRHLVTHFFFLISSFFGFLLIDFLYKNKLLATIGFLLIVLHPRLYAHSFFNTKDIPFMAMFLICLYLNSVAFRKKQNKYFFLLGIGVGLLINLRIMGMLLFSLIPFFLMIDVFKEKNYKVNIKLGLIFISTTIVTLYISWPFLWSNPLENFVFAFKNMARFRWGGSVLFNGQYIKATELSWDYIPRWFSITTPIFYLIAGLLGSILLGFHFFKNPSVYLSNSKQRNNLFFLICFLSPVVSVIIFRSVLYDGWRHLYFIYPSFVLLCIYGLNILYEKNMKKIVVIVSFIPFIFIGFFMIKNHPFQHVYFNELVDTKSPEYLRKQFELDYWGTSYKQSLEYILKYDHSPSINVSVENNPGFGNRQILTFKERKRIKFVKLQKATYFITNYRWHPQDYTNLNQGEWHSIKVGNNTINTIFRLR
jgi:hypothetical protein